MNYVINCVLRYGVEVCVVGEVIFFKFDFDIIKVWWVWCLEFRGFDIKGKFFISGVFVGVNFFFIFIEYSDFDFGIIIFGRVGFYSDWIWD